MHKKLPVRASKIDIFFCYFVFDIHKTKQKKCIYMKIRKTTNSKPTINSMYGIHKVTHMKYGEKEKKIPIYLWLHTATCISKYHTSIEDYYVQLYLN